MFTYFNRQWSLIILNSCENAFSSKSNGAHIHTDACANRRNLHPFMWLHRDVCGLHALTCIKYTHIHKWGHISINGNSEQLWNQTCKVGILSLSVSSALFFFPLSPLHLFFIMLSAISLSNCGLASLSLSASHFSVIEVNRSQPAEEERSVAVGSSLSPSAEEWEQMRSDTPHRWTEETQQMIKNGCVCVHACVYFWMGVIHTETVYVGVCVRHSLCVFTHSMAIRDFC